jgi:hypothetical protein
MTAFPGLFRVSVSVANFGEGLHKKFNALRSRRCPEGWSLTGFNQNFIFDFNGLEELTEKNLLKIRYFFPSTLSIKV